LLISLHVKNIAIINEVEVFFKEHLNILTGETGAGKSIIIDSINIALGGKVNRELIRKDKEYALVELVFETKDAKVHSLFKKLGIDINDNQIIISRKIMSSRSISRINGETVTLAILESIGGLLIDIHGQYDSQSLLQKSFHLEYLDQFSKDKISNIKENLETKYKDYNKIKNEYQNAIKDEDKRLRELSFIEYELNEINEAQLLDGEDEELEEKFKKLSNASEIKEALEYAYECTGYNSTESAGDLIGRSIKQLAKIADFDIEIKNYLSQLTDIEGLLNDFNNEISAYISEIESDYGLLDSVGKRLDTINHLKQKYGNTIPIIKEYSNQLQEKLDKFKNYDSYLENLERQLLSVEEELESLSSSLSLIRKSKSSDLTNKIKKELVELNFIDVKFDMVFNKLDYYTPNGYDVGEFIISTNPGEPLKPLSKVASGGELSRIMLGIKSVLADKDNIETLIFDEIDAGISGRTAQKVSEQLNLIANHHQVICITHLAQIAAMADAHYIIEKVSDKKSTQTLIRQLNNNESVDELARIIGGVEITDRTKESAIEMKDLAVNSKKNIK